MQTKNHVAIEKYLCPGWLLFTVYYQTHVSLWLRVAKAVETLTYQSNARLHTGNSIHTKEPFLQFAEIKDFISEWLIFCLTLISPLVYDKSIMIYIKSSKSRTGMYCECLLHVKPTVCYTSTFTKELKCCWFRRAIFAYMLQHLL